MKSDFVTKEDVLQLVQAKFQKQGIKPIEVNFTYDYSRKIYLWEITNVFKEWECSINKTCGDVEFIELDARDGKVLRFIQALQGPLH